LRPHSIQRPVSASNYEVLHHTELLADVMRESKLEGPG
jgi:hypothetical protein